MNVAFDDIVDPVSSSASSSFNSHMTHSDPRVNLTPGATSGVPTPEPATTHSTPAGPNDLNVNKVSGGRPGVSEKPHNGSPATRAAGRFFDPKDENGFAAFPRTTTLSDGPRQASPTRTTSANHLASAAAAAAGPAVRGAAGAAPGSASSSSSTPNTNNSTQPTNPAVVDFARHISESFFKCALCAKVAVDPVVITAQSALACRRCCLAVPGVTSTELPRPLREGMRTVKAAGGMPEGNDEFSGDRRFVRVKRNGVAPAAGASGVAGVSAAVWRELLEVMDGEPKERAQIEHDEAAARSALLSRKMSSAPKAGAAAATKPASSAPTSRQLKVEADRKYESAEYVAAVELYTRAIALQPQDKATNLKFLHGNRSAACYMAQRYDDCIADCLEVYRLEPSNTKLVSRAARAACTMGDLQRSVDILQSVPKERRSEENETDLQRYTSCLETFRHAERCFGTPEGDEQYRMLVAQCSDAVPFRIRSAESLQKQKHYMRAVEVLEALTYSSRTPKACRIMSECLYLSGFEHFERAKKCLVDAAQLDDECRALLKKIEAVDDGKQNGNANFNKKNYGPAAEFYGAAIQAASDNEQVLRVLYCNRAAAYKELGRYREGVEDCTKTLSIDKEFFKAYARRARCHEHLGDHFAAVRDYKKAIEYDSTDRELARELRAAEQNLAKEAEKEKDFYFQLGVTRSSTEREIKSKYRELSLRWHPDKCVGMDETERERAEHKFKIISEAYTTLLDPAKRREYDLKQDREKFARPGGYSFASTYSGSSSSNNNNEYFRGRHRAGTNGFW